MNTDQDQFKSKNDDRERTSATTSNGSSANSGDSNEEIIELTDVIKKGKGFENSDANFKFEQGPAQANSGSEAILGPDDDNLEKIIAGLETELELGDTEAIQENEEPVSPTPQDEPITLNSESAAEEEKPSLEVQNETPAISMEGINEAARSSEIGDEAPMTREPEETVPSTPQFDEIPMGSEKDKVETDISPVEAPDVALSISDEQIDRILTPMVREVIERTVRETVAEVAERVIREAIDSLKESIEPPRE